MRFYGVSTAKIQHPKKDLKIKGPRGRVEPLFGYFWKLLKFTIWHFFKLIKVFINKNA